MPWWPAPLAAGPVDATIAVPGSKSITNRALVLAALADGESVVRRPLHSRDTELMAAALATLGATVRSVDGGDWAVAGGTFSPAGDRVDVGNAGTVARFLPPVAALASGPVTFDGDPAIRRRPIGPLVSALRALGVDVDVDPAGGLPLTVRGHGRVPGGAVTVDASSSSQLVSGLLLAGARYDAGVEVSHVGPPVPSAPHLAMTVAMLREAGAQVSAPEDLTTSPTWRVAPGPLLPREWVVEPDLSSAAPFLAAAVVTAGTVRVRDWPVGTTQPGAALPDLFTAMGAHAEVVDGALVLTGPDRLHGLDADLHDVGELAPVVAAVAALADSPSRLRGIAHLRGHETDRLAALARELGARGADVRETDDGLQIRPASLHGGEFATYDDHRLAMAAAVVGLVVPGVLVEDVATTAKTLPDFVDRWTQMLGVSG